MNDALQARPATKAETDAGAVADDLRAAGPEDLDSLRDDLQDELAGLTTAGRPLSPRAWELGKQLIALDAAVTALMRQRFRESVQHG